MRAALLTAYGPPENLVIGETAKPEIGDNQILVRIHASSINPVDWKLRKGMLKLVTGINPPKILGHDFAGEVAAVGSKVTGYRVGDRVYGATKALSGGTYAEYVAVRSQHLSPMPAGLSFEQAASIPLATLTAYQGLLGSAQLHAGQTVLVNGASGGVGMAAVQIAKATGCHVTGVCGTSNVAFVRDLGADAVIDYTKEDVSQRRACYDVFFDCSGTSSFAAAKPSLKPGGHFVTTEPLPLMLIFGPLLNLWRSPKASVVTVVPSAADLAAVTHLVEQGRFKTAVTQVFALEQVAQAHALSETRRVAGKLVLQIA